MHDTYIIRAQCSMTDWRVCVSMCVCVCVPKTPRGPLVGGGASCVPTVEDEDDVLSYC